MSNQGLRTFYTIAVTQAVSRAASLMTTFAIGVWIFSSTWDTTPLLMATFFTMLPMALLNGAAGVLADRFDRKRLIVLSDAAQALPTLLLMLSFATNRFEVWQLYAASFVQSFFGMVQGPAFAASIAMLVPEQHRDRANAVNEMLIPASSLTAPVLGGFLYGVIGVTGIMALDVLSFFLAVAVIGRQHIPQPKQSRESAASQGSIWREMKGAALFMWHRKPILVMCGYFLFLNFITGGIWRLLSPYVLTQVGYDERLLGVVSGIINLGLVGGGLIPLVLKIKGNRMHWMMPALMAAGVGLMAFALSRSVPAVAVVGFLMMLPYKMTNALMASISQGKIPPDMQGRVYGLTGQISIFGMPLIYLITAPLVDNVLEPLVMTDAWRPFAPLFGSAAGSGMALYIFACGAITLLGTALVYALPMIRHMERNLVDYVGEDVPEPESAPLLEGVPTMSGD